MAAASLLAAAGAVAEPRFIHVQENDGLTGMRDFGYTQGLRTSLVFDTFSNIPLVERGFDLVGGLFALGGIHGEVRRQFEWIVVGQSIFTPFDKSLVIPNPLDRPYAGWLYTGASFVQETGGRRLDSFEVLLGVVGPSAGGRAVQEWAHKLFGDGTPILGWGSQIRDEPAFLVAWDRRWKFGPQDPGSFGYEIIPSTGVTLGNVYTYASAGIMFRIGRWLSANWGQTRIRPALSGASFHASDRMSGFGYAFFFGAEGRAILHNMFLHGNTLVGGGPPSVAHNVLVADLIAGVEAFTPSGSRLGFSLTMRSAEFKNQPKDGDIFGALDIGLRF